MDLSIKRVPQQQVARLRQRAKANHRSLQGELRALIEEATSVVDGSAVVGLLFNEVRQEKVVARLRGASLHAPALVEFEVAND